MPSPRILRCRQPVPRFLGQRGDQAVPDGPSHALRRYGMGFDTGEAGKGAHLAQTGCRTHKLEPLRQRPRRPSHAVEELRGPATHHRVFPVLRQGRVLLHARLPLGHDLARGLNRTQLVIRRAQLLRGHAVFRGQPFEHGRERGFRNGVENDAHFLDDEADRFRRGRDRKGRAQDAEVDVGGPALHDLHGLLALLLVPVPQPWAESVAGTVAKSAAPERVAERLLRAARLALHVEIGQRCRSAVGTQVQDWRVADAPRPVAMRPPFPGEVRHVAAPAGQHERTGVR